MDELWHNETYCKIPWSVLLTTAFWRLSAPSHDPKKYKKQKLYKKYKNSAVSNQMECYNISVCNNQYYVVS